MAQKTSKRKVDRAQTAFAEICKALQDIEVYNPLHDPLIRSCAQQIAVRDAAYQDIVAHGVTVEERTGAGEVKLKLNPAFNAYRDVSKELRGSLNDLAMNVRSSMVPTEDKVDHLTKVLDAISAGGDA